MPRYDGTGPLGFGPGTGWGLGPCGAGMGYRRLARRSLGTGGGWGRGFGRYWRFGSQISEKEEQQVLEEEKEALEDELKSIKERLTELEGQK